jgi:hypothetical protein
MNLEVFGPPPSSLEPIIRLEAMIDARIDKALISLCSAQQRRRPFGTISWDAGGWQHITASRIDFAPK